MEDNIGFFYNDEPIHNFNEDSLSRTDFVSNLANSILSYNDNNGLVIGLQGKWGSGKTSIINLLVEKIEDIQKDCKIMNKHKILFFNPWNFTEQDQLISIFFKEIVAQLRTIYFYLGKKQIQIRNKEIKSNDIRSYCNLIVSIAESLQYIPIISPIARSIASPLKKMGEVLSNKKNESLKKSKRRLEKKLSKIKYKIVIVIDDMID
jgi:hypothetical protein